MLSPCKLRGQPAEREAGQRSRNGTAGWTGRCACWTSTKARDPFCGHTGGSKRMGTRVCPFRRPLRCGQKNRKNAPVRAHFIFPIDLLRKGKFLATRHFARCEWPSALVLCLRQDDQKGEDASSAPLPSGKKNQKCNFLSYNQKNARTRSNGVMLHGPASELCVCWSAPYKGIPSLIANRLA